MPRVVTWIKRLHEIRRSVTHSIRSHYERKDIERLFQLRPRAAQSLMQGISPGARVGNSFLLPRSDLQRFLDQVHGGADPNTLLTAREAAPRCTLRELIQVDQIPATLETIPTNVRCEVGQLSINFATMEELAGALFALGQILESEGGFADFEQRYVPSTIQQQDPEAHQARSEVARLFAALQAMEQQSAHVIEPPRGNLS